MNYILKLDSAFVDDIFKGVMRKTVEYRKQNKAYIREGDKITFVDLDCKTVFGTVKVNKVNIVYKRDLPLHKAHRMSGWQNETYRFIRDHYKEEYILLEFEIEPIKD